MNKGNDFISIRAYFQINGIKVAKPEPIDPHHTPWLDMYNKHTQPFPFELLERHFVNFEKEFLQIPVATEHEYCSRCDRLKSECICRYR